MIEALTWALKLDPATLKWPAAVLLALCCGLVLFGLVQYQAFNRLWGLHLVLGLASGAVVIGLGAAIHWLLGVLYGVRGPGSDLLKIIMAEAAENQRAARCVSIATTR